MKEDTATFLPAGNYLRVTVAEAAIRELTAQLLGTLGYEVTAVPDGLEAIRT